jgi:hypothetical protein
MPASCASLMPALVAAAVDVDALEAATVVAICANNSSSTCDVAALTARLVGAEVSCWCEKHVRCVKHAAADRVAMHTSITVVAAGLVRSFLDSNADNCASLPATLLNKYHNQPLLVDGCIALHCIAPYVE